MSRSKEFGKGLAAGGHHCVGCGEGIDMSKAVEAKEGYASRGNEHTAHFDIDGDVVARDYHKAGQHNDKGMHCPACLQAIEEGQQQTAEAGPEDITTRSAR